MPPYQPRWVRGRATTEGQRDAEGRYLAIKDVLDDEEPIGKVLDFGAYGGYFSFRLAEDFQAQVVAVDDHDELKRGIAANRNDLVSAIHNRMTPGSVLGLGRFDVVLALSVLHHVPEWEKMLVALMDVTDRFFFIETPGPEENLPNAINPLGRIWTAVQRLSDDLGGVTITRVAGYDGRYTRELKVVRFT